MTDRVRLVTERWETKEEICQRTGSTRDIVTHALKRLWKENLLSCIFPDAESNDQRLRYKLRRQSDAAVVEA